MALCHPFLAFMKERMFMYVCTVISAPSALTQTCQHFSLFQTNLQMCRDNVPGCFRETDCLVKRSCPGSFLPQGVQQELLGWLQKELIQEEALINAPSIGGAPCQSLERCVGDQFSLILTNHLVYLGNGTQSRNGLHDMKS